MRCRRVVIVGGQPDAAGIDDQPAVRERDGTLTRTADEDDGIMWLPTAATPRDVTGAGDIACPWRPGDVW